MFIESFEKNLVLFTAEEKKGCVDGSIVETIPDRITQIYLTAKHKPTSRGSLFSPLFSNSLFPHSFPCPPSRDEFLFSHVNFVKSFSIKFVLKAKK